MYTKAINSVFQIIIKEHNIITLAIIGHWNGLGKNVLLEFKIICTLYCVTLGQNVY